MITYTLWEDCRLLGTDLHPRGAFAVLIDLGFSPAHAMQALWSADDDSPLLYAGVTIQANKE